MELKEIFINYLLAFLGRPYIWAGDGSPRLFGGFDCSGLVLEGLWACGLYSGQDTTAEGLRQWCAKDLNTVGYKDRGALLFFGSNSKASHVAVSIGGGLMIEAGGAGSEAKTPETSKGFVRVRPIGSRRGLIAAYMPNFG